MTRTGGVFELFRGESLAWQDQAACRTEPSSLFFDGDYTTAKTICTACPVRETCGDFALSHRIEYGVWGGLSPRDRGFLRSDEVEYRTGTCVGCGGSFRYGVVGRRTRVPKHCGWLCRRESRASAAKRLHAKRRGPEVSGAGSGSVSA